MFDIFLTEQERKHEFFTDWETGTSGRVLGRDKKSVMCDFAIRLNTMVEANEMTGFHCDIKREMDKAERYNIFQV